VRNTVIIALATLLAFPATGAAQWSITAEVAANHFWGTTAQPAGEQAQAGFRPYRPASFGFRLERRSHAVRLGVALSYFDAGLGLESSETIVIASNVLTVYSAAPEIGLRVARSAAGAELWASGGPLIEIWKPIDLDSRTRGGGQAALSLEVPLTGRLGGTARFGVAVLPSSPFTREELIEEFEPAAAWRRSFTAGLRYRL
jgi:hypothetical protein